MERGSARRRLLVARNSLFSEPGDVEVGEYAEQISTRRRGFIKSVGETNVVLTLGRDFRCIVPLDDIRAIRERAKGPDTRAAGRR